jgi:hypothetical protein
MCAVSPLPSDDDFSAHNHRGSSRSRTVSPQALDTSGHMTLSHLAANTGVAGSKLHPENNPHDLCLEDVDLDVEVKTSLTSERLRQATASGSSASSRSSGRSSQEEEPEPGKLVSITPDIVKPVKEVKDSQDNILQEVRVSEQQEQDGAATAKSDGGGATEVSSHVLLKSGSSGRLPDMLTHTPDGLQQACGSLTRGSVGGTVLVFPVLTSPGGEGDGGQLQQQPVSGEGISALSVHRYINKRTIILIFSVTCLLRYRYREI